MRKYLREYTEDFMKKSLLKSALLIVMIALLTASLAACGLFNSQKKISNLEITGNVIQQNLIDGATDVELSVSWNENALKDGTEVAIAWYVDGKKQDDTSKNFVYSVSKISDECTVEIKVELTDGTQTTHAEISLVFVKRYALADSLSVVPTSEMVEVCKDTYFFKATPQGDKTKTFSTTLLPLGANQSASCEWTLTDSTGKTSVVEKSARVASVALSYGKNTLKATVQNVESRQIIVYALEYDFENIPTGVKDAMQNKFLWLPRKMLLRIFRKNSRHTHV